MSLLRLFRFVGTLESISYLLLLGVAMPLKYLWHMPIYVRWTGSIHGALFVLFTILVVMMARQKHWTAKTAALAFGSAFFPLGPQLFDRYFLPSEPPAQTQNRA
jgi:integral membrane protein